MRAFLIVAGLVITLNACDPGSSNDAKGPSPSVDLMQPASWEIGPVIDGKNSSLGLPLRPDALENGWGFALTPTTEPHYVTAHYGSLAGKSQIKMVYDLQIDGQDHVYPRCCVNEQGVITLYFQRKGDDWNTEGSRWWATFASVPLEPGVHEIVAPLDGRWTSVMTMNAVDSYGVFARAKNEADRIGFTFGGGSSNDSGYGHGVRSTGPAVFTVRSFTVE
jgi:hypothetical protein